MEATLEVPAKKVKVKAKAAARASSKKLVPATEATHPLCVSEAAKAMVETDAANEASTPARGVWKKKVDKARLLADSVLGQLVTKGDEASCHSCSDEGEWSDASVTSPDVSSERLWGWSASCTPVPPPFRSEEMEEDAYF